ncbi:hypothetical protein MXD81_58775 [Microbacteriaceae bacterium K1510]|nr:hypothetical protein [Microbacteriaceae bacterium K1510]
MPQPDNWTTRIQNGGTTYVCKPLACADQVQVTITTGRSPTNNPNPQALEKLAKVDLPKRLKAIVAAAAVMADTETKVETLSAKVTTKLGYPSVDDELKVVRGKTVVFSRFVIIFAGPLSITATTTSPNREVAVKTLDEFVAGMKVTPVSPPPSKPDVPPTSPI